MKHTLLPIINLWILASLFFFQGCKDETDESDNTPVGKAVVFTAASGFDEGDATRTAYSGEYFGDNPTYERIDWVENDLIRIYSDQALVHTIPTRGYADYKVTDVSTNGRYSGAQVSPLEEGAGLVWEPGVNKFYALYPSPETEGVPAQYVGIVSVNFSVHVPATQTLTQKNGVWQPDMKTAYMWAAASAVSTEGTVQLNFHPAVTAFEFTIVSAENEPMTLKSFELSSTSHALNGTATGTVNEGLADCSYICPTRRVEGSEDNSRITINFGSDGIEIPAGNSTTFTVFALPQELKNLTASFTTEEYGVRSLPLSEDNVPCVFEACRKYRFPNLRIPGGDL